MPSTARLLVLSTHPVPSIAVSAIAVILGWGVGLEPWRLVILGLAFLANQSSVGLSNDWIDADRDRAVGRTDKPVALGLISKPVARAAAFTLGGAAILLTIPLGWGATLAHTIFIASAWAYNAGLKSTLFSVVPYIVSFGLLPLVVTLARSEPAVASPWALVAGALLGVSAHFANVLPDLDDDRQTGVSGLPHRVGPRVSGLVIAGALAAASVSVVLGIGGASVVHYVGLAASLVLAATCAVLVISGRAQGWVFRLIILGALIDVALLALSGVRLIA